MPELTAQVARAVAARGPYPLAMRVRDELGELFADAEFAEAFGSRGRPGWSPGQLALVTVAQFAENLTDRAAVHRVRYGMDLKYALGLELDDPGFDASVLSEFRTRLVEHGMEEKVLDLLLTALKDRGLVKAGGRQRTDSTRVLAAVRDLNRLELAGETLRAALEVLACAAPDWLAGAGARSRVGRPLRTADSLLASAGFYEQARGAGPGLRPGRVRAAGCGS
ncbi:transposase [Streptomyces achromogenes]|uniref:transposase n=1 Tax=Streptomyces achromogenes TaxID=67255 RepID=UPI0027D77ADE|nr:transposase [Streptomyces achromogenes]